MSPRSGAGAELRLRYADAETAGAVADAVSPDNYQAPEGMEVVVTRSGAEIRVRVVCPKGVGSLVQTLDDLMSCIAAAERTIGGLT